jgi:hypothetical protein
MMREVKVTINADRDPLTTAVQIAQWVRDVCPDQYTSADAMMIARYLLHGETWRPEYATFDFSRVGTDELCMIEIDTSYDDYDEELRTAREKQASYYELLKRGAEGDTDAAIAYCKLELDGLVNHSACGQ